MVAHTFADLAKLLSWTASSLFVTGGGVSIRQTSGSYVNPADQVNEAEKGEADQAMALQQTVSAASQRASTDRYGRRVLTAAWADLH